MKKIVLSLFFIFSFFVFFVSLVKAEVPIYFFYGQGCPHCQIVEKWFEENKLYSKYPIQKKEVYFNRENATLFTNYLYSLNYKGDSIGVPTVIIDKKILVGDKIIIKEFIKEADLYIKRTGNEKKEEKGNNEKKAIDLTLLAVIGASAVDAINPCAFAVLIILMSTILASGNGKKALLSGMAFSASIFISYLLMGVGLYKAIELGKFSGGFYRLIGYLAIFLGLANLKDFFWYGKGFLMEVPLGWRPTLKKLIASITGPWGAFGIGFLVSLFLLPCTSGPYIVILSMLAKEPFNIKAISYLILYNLIFVLPMLLISIAVYKGFDPAKAEKIRQKKLRHLHLVAGLILFLMGVVIAVGWI